jgi:ectoine hydroxylase-related dioxygenase (phytanoyl-CoA dioxygenase family)
MHGGETMNDVTSHTVLSATEHADAMREYFTAGTAQARALGNRGPIRLDSNGKLDRDILDAYWELGFYVFEGVVGAEELAELRADVDRMLEQAPVAPGAERDAQGRPAFGSEFVRPPYRFAKPLSDPLGGTGKNKGRHPVKMHEATPPSDAPAYVIELLSGNLQLMDSALRLYGHPGLLAVAEAVLGSDFVPYNEVTFIKEPGLGPSVAWHRDGTTHWNAPDWDQGAHGFNFMTQLYPSTAGNCVWIVPRTHKERRIDIKQMVIDAGSERIANAIPLLGYAGDTFILNRQMVHGSFANSSPDRRVTLNMGFFPRKRIEGVTTSHLDGRIVTFSREQIHERSRMIAIGIDARRQRFPDETPYRYQPLADEEDENRWNENTRRNVVRNYNLRDMYI